MRDFGSSILESRREGSRLVVVVMGFLVKEGLSEESGQQGRRRDEDSETPAARSRREGIFEHQRRNMLINGGSGGKERAKLLWACALRLLLPPILERIGDRVASVHLEFELLPFDLVVAFLHVVVVV